MDRRTVARRWVAATTLIGVVVGGSVAQRGHDLADAQPRFVNAARASISESQPALTVRSAGP